MKHKNAKFRQIISLPIIWSVLIPVVITDIWLELYHRSCFPLYGIQYVKRSQHIKIDRHKLEYLKWYEKMGCAYCGYVNGLASYWTEIAGKTEKYWCGIMHQQDGVFKAPKHHKEFVEYNDKKAFTDKYGR